MLQSCDFPRGKETIGVPVPRIWVHRLILCLEAWPPAGGVCVPLSCRVSAGAPWRTSPFSLPVTFLTGSAACSNPHSEEGTPTAVGAGNGAEDGTSSFRPHRVAVSQWPLEELPQKACLEPSMEAGDCQLGCVHGSSSAHATVKHGWAKEYDR